MTDYLRSPRRPNHQFEIRPADDKSDLSVTSDTDDVVIITGDGALRLSPDDVRADTLRLKPRLNGKATRHIVAAANINWALEDVNG